MKEIYSPDIKELQKVKDFLHDYLFIDMITKIGNDKIHILVSIVMGKYNYVRIKSHYHKKFSDIKLWVNELINKEILFRTTKKIKIYNKWKNILFRFLSHAVYPKAKTESEFIKQIMEGTKGQKRIELIRDTMKWILKENGFKYRKYKFLYDFLKEFIEWYKPHKKYKNISASIMETCFSGFKFKDLQKEYKEVLKLIKEETK